MEEKTYEMLWDCEYCSAQKLLGVTHRFCPECGAAQNPQKRYFPPDDQKVAVQDHQYVGADLVCPACSQPQSAAVKHCTNCGSPLQAGQAVFRHADQVVGPGGAIQPAQAPPPTDKSGGIPWWVFALIGVVVLVIGVILVNRFWTKEAALEVTRHTWERSIEVERYGDVKETKPCSDVPSNAKILRRDKGQKTCKTRKVDQGDGTFKEKQECTEPVEQCTYTVKKWQKARVLEEKGEGLSSTPRWPTVDLKKTGTCD
ncbi:MAG: hypothetical protein KC731_28680, partial [Myxococcales bacterium]|nr:hypothetical protein [Myxococcales bacterium]